ncbi:hypothetical protein CHISP_2523 [Chitinispirillum alkaliphilum]|nr:hypothetical protein CHISP_2523 [Chitinispirillum alkaliphilum]
MSWVTIVNCRKHLFHKGGVVDTELLETLNTTFSTTMENMAFLFSDLLDKDCAVFNDKTYYSSIISFTGVSCGELRMAAPESTCCILAANMLGLEPEDQQVVNKAADAFKEALNIICGQFLTNVFGEKEVFILSTPSLVKYGCEKAMRNLNDENVLCFSVEEKPFLISLHISK